MKAEIITIGDEILIGQIVNTNSVWIAQQLNLIGIDVVHMASVSDSENGIIQSLEQAKYRADFIFITGGLGPTKDDITKKTLAKYFESELEINRNVLDHVNSFFDKRGRPLTETNRLQALLPKNCMVIENHHGTAPGMWFEKDKKVFISMPGVPYEMKAMMSEIILPEIKRNYSLPAIYHRTILLNGITESNLSDLIEKWELSLSKKKIKLAYLPQPGMVRLRLSSSGESFENLKRDINNQIEIVLPLIEKFIFGFEEYGEDPPTLEKTISDLLRERNQTLSVAESCTGGYVTSLFTAIPGASQIFRGAVVPYANITKHTLLEVDKNLFDTVGAVSKECVIQLAENVLKKFNSDFSISISGIAGPTGGTPEKPVGLVWIAVADKEKTIPIKFQFGDNRQRNIIMTANAAMSMLRKLILKQELDKNN